MRGVKLSQRTIDALQAGAKPYIAFDHDLKGFGVRVMPSGAKSFVIEYRPGGGGRGVNKRRHKISDLGDFTPAQARKAAKGLLAKVRLGGDPAGERSAARAQITVSELMDDYLRDVEAKLKPRTAGVYRDILLRLVKPEIGSRKVEALTRGALARLHLARKDTPVQANRMLAVIGAMYSFAATHHIVADGFNPARKIPHFKELGRERFLNNDELDRIGAALREAETQGIPWPIDSTKPTAKHAPRAEKRVAKLSPHAVGAIRLLLFTGCRLREILGLRWDEVNFERGLLFLPDSKTGRKTVVLNAPAVAVLATLPRIGRYVIAGEAAGSKDEKPRADLHRPWATICRRASLIGVRIHDLRHTHASIAAAGGLGLPVIGKLLGHKQAATTARYAHLDIDPQRRASEYIGAALREAMGDVPRNLEPATVIPLRSTGG